MWWYARLNKDQDQSHMRYNVTPLTAKFTGMAPGTSGAHGTREVNRFPKESTQTHFQFMITHLYKYLLQVKDT